MIFNAQAQSLSKHYYKIPLNNQGLPESCPDEIFNSVLKTAKETIDKAQIEASEIRCIGITNQRVTFTSWDRKTGKYIHPFISWSDIRGSEVCDTANNNIFTVLLRKVCSILHFFTRSPKFLTASRLNIKNNQSGPKMCWVMCHDKKVIETCKRGDLCVGTLDSWLIWNFTGHKIHATDISNASATGFYDPYALCWSQLVSFLLFPYRLPPWKSLPEIKQSADFFGYTKKKFFGHKIPICGVIADQQASLFGQCCFNSGHYIKATIGTGMFVNMCTGTKAQASYGGLYPLVAWSVDKQVKYAMEGSENSAGVIIEWMKELNFITHLDEIDEIAKEYKDSEGVFFISSLSGLGSPYYDPHAKGMFIGMTSKTKKGHLVRAMVDSFGYRMHDIVKTFLKELLGKYDKITSIRVDGGVAQNDHICQAIADITNIKVERPYNLDMTCLGAAYIAGLSSGMWKSMDEINKFQKIQKVFEPSMDPKIREKNLLFWQDAISRTKDWPTYDDTTKKAKQRNDKLFHKNRFGLRIWIFITLICIYIIYVTMRHHVFSVY